MYKYWIEEPLKPCPFCGGEAIPDLYSRSCGHGLSDEIFEIKCKDCGAKGPRTTSLSYTVDDSIVREVVTKWNQRF